MIAKFQRTDLVICSHSREGETLSYSGINTVMVYLALKAGLVERDYCKCHLWCPSEVERLWNRILSCTYFFFDFMHTRSTSVFKLMKYLKPTVYCKTLNICSIKISQFNENDILPQINSGAHVTL